MVAHRQMNGSVKTVAAETFDNKRNLMKISSENSCQERNNYKFLSINHTVAWLPAS